MRILVMTMALFSIAACSTTTSKPEADAQASPEKQRAACEKMCEIGGEEVGEGANLAAVDECKKGCG